MYYVASVSFGKDSLAMLLLLLEKKCPLDEVIFYDTGMEFKAIYNIRDKVLPILHTYGIKYTELQPNNPFLYDMFERPRKAGGKGWSWCGGACRWGTGEKLKCIKKYLNQYAEYTEYVGIASDEKDRLLKEREDTKVFPLADWSMVEQ